MTASQRHTVPYSPVEAGRNAGRPAGSQATGRGPAAVLGTITQERGHGGIARVSVLLWKAMEELAPGPCRRVALVENSREAGPRAKLRFAWEIARMQLRGQVRWILFDHVGVAAVQSLVPRRWRAPYAVFLHGVEVWGSLRPRHKEVLRSAAIRIANSHYTAGRVAQMHPDIGPVEACPLALVGEQHDHQHAQQHNEPRPAWDADSSADSSENPDPAVIARLGRNTVLMVGRMASSERYKGHDQLIAAWPLVANAVPDAQLVIVGAGDDLARLKAAAARSASGDAIYFTGRISDRTLEMLYARAAIFAMPGRGEGFGLVYLEAMRHGLACVAGIHDAAGEVVEDGQTGFLVDQDNIPELARVLVQLLHDPALAKQMGDAGLRRLKTCFSFDQFRTRLGAILAPFLAL
jgi:phosphatidyl-myo-inositol dimannoside synthase